MSTKAETAYEDTKFVVEEIRLVGQNIDKTVATIAYSIDPETGLYTIHGHTRGGTKT